MTKLTEAQKKERLKARLSYQKHCKHFEIEKFGEIWKCISCLKEFTEGSEWHGHEIESFDEHLESWKD